ESRRVFLLRSKIVAGVRQFLSEQGFMEVETPMLQVQAGGAAAKPFHTHHNAMDMELVLRIAPELYLKRLVVGGFEKVFELNRNFRNEGISTRHNPEFTMIEFYQAYANYQDLMDLTEKLFINLAQDVLGSHEIQFQDTVIDLSKAFQRFTLRESITHFNPEIKLSDLDDMAKATALAAQHKIAILPGSGLGKVQTLLFEELVEKKLKQPTFITEFPTEVSPLSRPNDANPFVADRFELYVGGQEIANGFSELNDPEDQAQRFHDQVKAAQAGDEEAMSYDEDYITALEYGLPPTAGEGIGIDRLVMLFANCASIREVILFPLLRQK
ncbi:MAG TPA: lysine--tRNA ligase, partial [Coxiellaceae bacterium]|nr:lysine--tRNA ligase [Coxiellaceae bacterium]